MSGWPGYGYVGGGLAIYDLKTGVSQLIKHTDLVPDQSTYQLRRSAERRHRRRDEHQRRARHDAGRERREALHTGLENQKTVTYSIVPVPGAEGVDSLVVARDGLVYAITTPPTLFVFDPETRRIIHQRDLAGHGTIAYNGLKLGPDGDLYAVLTKALLRITPGTYAVEKLAEPPEPVARGDGRRGRPALLCDRLPPLEL